MYCKLVSVSLLAKTPNTRIAFKYNEKSAFYRKSCFSTKKDESSFIYIQFENN